MAANMKNIISDAFFALTRQKNIDKITVKDLVEACGISRQTFYYHFQDIFEVIEWSAQQALQQALSKSLACETPEDAIRELVSATVREFGLIEKLLSSQKRAFIEKTFVGIIETYLRELLRNRAPKLSAHYAGIETALYFYACGIVGVLMKYGGKTQLDIDLLSQQIRLLLFGTYFHLEP